MTKQIFSALKVSALALVISFGMSYAFAWTAPSTTPPDGNVSAPLNTSATTQTKTGALNVVQSVSSLYPNIGSFSFAGASGIPHFSLTNSGTNGTRIVQQFNAKDSSGVNKYYNLDLDAANATFTLGGPGASRVDVTGTIKATGGYVGNGPIPLTPHYVNRSEDTYGAGSWYYQYCNGFYNHDTCNGDYNSSFTCPKSANITSCVDAFPAPEPRTDFCWCGSYFRDRTVTCKINEVLSTYDDNI